VCDARDTLEEGKMKSRLTTAVGIVASLVLDVCIQVVRQAAVELLPVLVLALTRLFRLQRARRIYIRYNLIDSVKRLVAAAGVVIVIVTQWLFVDVLL
jgi:hypothetical protein